MPVDKFESSRSAGKSTDDAATKDYIYRVQFKTVKDTDTPNQDVTLLKFPLEKKTSNGKNHDSRESALSVNRATDLPYNVQHLIAATQAFINPQAHRRF